MRLKCYYEYASNNHDNFIDFNNNEIKYLRDKANLRLSEIKGSDIMFVNARQVTKLKTNEYLVINDNIKCSTIQSLVKYTENSIKDIKQKLKDIIHNIKIEKESNTSALWYYNDTYWAQQENFEDEYFLYIDIKAIMSLLDKINLQRRELKILIIIEIEFIDKFKDCIIIFTND